MGRGARTEQTEAVSTRVHDSVEKKFPCYHCGGSGHDAVPGPTGEPVSIGPCPICEGEGLISESEELKHQASLRIDEDLPF